MNTDKHGYRMGRSRRRQSALISFVGAASMICPGGSRRCKAAEDSRTPGRCRDLLRPTLRGSVLECGCPLPLWIGCADAILSHRTRNLAPTDVVGYAWPALS